MSARFSSTISNEELQGLPIRRFEGEIIVVDTEDQCRLACSDLSTARHIGFDTETRPKFKSGPLNKVALLQLSTDDRCYLFRLCKMPFGRPLLGLLENRKIVKIGADIHGDLRALGNLRHFKAHNFVDLQKMMPEYGISDISVRKMAGIILGCKVSKAQRLSNWEAATLTEAQKLYAATDAWICLQMFRQITLDNESKDYTQTE